MNSKKLIIVILTNTDFAENISINEKGYKSGKNFYSKGFGAKRFTRRQDGYVRSLCHEIRNTSLLHGRL